MHILPNEQDIVIVASILSGGILGVAAYCLTRALERITIPRWTWRKRKGAA